MSDLLHIIRDFADKAHGDQTRRYSPERYIEHPVRVMKTCSEFTSDETVLAAALLHDVLEDTSVTAEELTVFLMPLFGEFNTRLTMELVTDLTDIYTKKNYPDWNRRKRKKMEVERLSGISSKAQTVKYADILDNVNSIVLDDRDFAGVFLKECEQILQKLDQGNAELHRLAAKAVENNLRLLKKRS